MAKKFWKLIDNLLLIIIFVSIIQIIVGDFAVIGRWSERFSWGNGFDIGMIIAGFAFDAIFTLEFMVRAIVAVQNRDFKNYFFYRKGWIDLIASLPLLLLISAPSFYVYMTTGEVAGVSRMMIGNLKIIKAIRVTRILRLLRTLKIFGKIENVFSKMSQHHVTTIASMVVTVSIFTFMIISLTGLLNYGNISEAELAIVEARVSLAFTFVILANVIFIVIFYSKHFAQNVSDPIYVMKRGMLEDGYNFTAKIKPQFGEEEVFELAKAYNSLWLPMKVRIQSIRARKQQEAENKDMGMDEDYSDLF